MNNVVALVPVLVASVAIGAVPAAQASPLVPQQGSSCPATADGALAGQSGDGFTQCIDGQWHDIADAPPRSDRWLTSGPALDLRGPAQAGPQLAPGNWVAEPQDTSTRCSILQVVLVNPPDQIIPQLTAGNAGEQLTFVIQERLVTGRLTGNCLWRRVAT